MWWILRLYNLVKPSLSLTPNSTIKLHIGSIIESLFKELGDQEWVTIPFNKIEQFITYYLNIKVSYTKIAWIYFKSSFGVSGKIYNGKDLYSLIDNLDNDQEILKLFKRDKVESSNMSIGSWIEDNQIINEKLKYNMKRICKINNK